MGSGEVEARASKSRAEWRHQIDEKLQEGCQKVSIRLASLRSAQHLPRPRPRTLRQVAQCQREDCGVPKRASFVAEGNEAQRISATATAAAWSGSG